MGIWWTDFWSLIYSKALQGWLVSWLAVPHSKGLSIFLHSPECQFSPRSGSMVAATCRYHLQTPQHLREAGTWLPASHFKMEGNFCRSLPASKAFHWPEMSYIPTHASSISSKMISWRPLICSLGQGWALPSLKHPAIQGRIKPQENCVVRKQKGNGMDRKTWGNWCGQKINSFCCHIFLI